MVLKEDESEDIGEASKVMRPDVVKDFLAE
jgi:hypothetical protein